MNVMHLNGDMKSRKKGDVDPGRVREKVLEAERVSYIVSIKMVWNLYNFTVLCDLDYELGAMEHNMETQSRKKYKEHCRF